MDETSDELSCSLAPDELVDRVTAWKRIDAMAVDRARTGDGFRVRYRKVSGINASLSALAAAERGCCNWATWSVTDTEEHCVLEVSGPADKLGPLAFAFGVAT